MGILVSESSGLEIEAVHDCYLHEVDEDLTKAAYRCTDPLCKKSIRPRDQIMESLQVLRGGMMGDDDVMSSFTLARHRQIQQLPGIFPIKRSK